MCTVGIVPYRRIYIYTHFHNNDAFVSVRDIHTDSGHISRRRGSGDEMICWLLTAAVAARSGKRNFFFGRAINLVLYCYFCPLISFCAPHTSMYTVCARKGIRKSSASEFITHSM